MFKLMSRFLVLNLLIMVIGLDSFANANANNNEKSREELIHILKHDCGSCHGMSLKGGLGPSLLKERMRLQSLESIKSTISLGRPGTAMPPWKSLLSENDIEKLAKLLQESY